MAASGIDCQQLLEEATDQVGSVDEVNFQYPMTGQAIVIRLTKPQIVAMTDGEALRLCS
jgi:hypothetical protein